MTARKKRKAAPAATAEDRRAGESAEQIDRRLPLVLAGVALSVSIALRLTGMTSDLWLDELWSLQTASQMRSAFDVLTLHHEINHHLNTLWLYFVGEDAGPFLLRLPALVAGVLSVIVGGMIGLRRSVATGVLAIILVGFSYELILYSSEARGYAALVLFSLLALYFLDRWFEQFRWQWALAYGASGVLGVFSHPAFAAVLAAAATWTAYRLIRSGSTSAAPRRFFAIQGGPLLAFLLLYLIDLRLVVAGGGTPNESLIDAFGVSLAWALGTPSSPVMKLIFCILGVIVLDAGLRRLWLEKSDSWTFFAGAIIVFPILLVVARGSSLVYTRHFLAGTTFLILLLAFILGVWWEHGRRWLCVGVILLYCAANGWHVVELATRGRGRYQEAIRYMAEHTPGPVITIAGDHDFRIGFELSYYLPRVLGSREAKYFEQGAWPAGGPEWIITHRESFEAASPTRDSLGDGSGNQYDLSAVFPTAPLSGLHWFLYHKRAVR